MNLGPETCYRLSRRFLYTGIGCIAFFAVAGAGSCVMALVNPDGSFAHPAKAAAGFGLFWFLWLLLGIYVTATAIRYRLYVDADRVEEIGCFRRRAIQLDEVSVARWRLIPKGGSLSLRGFSGKLTVAFDGFGTQDRRELIEFFHRHLAEHVQEGWQQFEARFLPLHV